ncbi:MAG: sterol desaturase family protein [Oligoflexus sp.]|nr:sterol desaturase family protein [Oligoflexus sp.]
MLTVAIPLLAFWALFLLSCLKLNYRQALSNKPRAAWAMDALGLLVQGWLIPLLQAYLLLPVLNLLMPGFEGIIEIPFFVAFLISFIAVDYLYYWNHRTLHIARLWPWHRAHHSAETMDIFVSSRNSLWTHLLICYVWVHSLSIFLLKDDHGYFFGIALGSALDLWRHSGMRLPGLLTRVLGCVFVLPKDHAWHHAVDSKGANFGANFNLWDKLHGTWEAPADLDFAVGDSDHYKLQYRDLFRSIRS